LLVSAQFNSSNIKMKLTTLAVNVLCTILLITKRGTASTVSKYAYLTGTY
jgi:hypothetical protein